MIHVRAGGFEAGFDTGQSPAGGYGTSASSGQTREHAQLARSLGIEQLAVVVSKLDTCDFSQVCRAHPWGSYHIAPILSAQDDSKALINATSPRSARRIFGAHIILDIMVHDTPPAASVGRHAHLSQALFDASYTGLAQHMSPMQQEVDTHSSKHQIISEHTACRLACSRVSLLLS